KDLLSSSPGQILRRFAPQDDKEGASLLSDDTEAHSYAGVWGSIASRNFSSRRRVVSLPSRAMTSKSGAPTVVPVRASRVGWINFPAEMALSSAVARSADSRAGVLQSSSARKRAESFCKRAGVSGLTGFFI